MTDPAPAPGDETAAEISSAREPAFNIPGVVLALVAICAGVHLLRVYLLTAEQDFGLIVRAAFIPLRYSGFYEIDLYALTSPVTYAFLHGGWGHLAINMIWLAAFGPPLANRFGPARFLLFWIATALAAALLHYMLHQLDPSPLVGASGAISGMMGAAARYGFRTDRAAGRPVFSGALFTVGRALASRNVLVFLAVWMIVNLIAGLGLLTPGMENPIAWEAHIGGFLAGFFGVRLFDPWARVG